MLWIMLVINEVTQKGGNRETHQVSSLSLSRGVTSTHWPSATQGRHRVVTELKRDVHRDMHAQSRRV